MFYSENIGHPKPLPKIVKHELQDGRSIQINNPTEAQLVDVGWLDGLTRFPADQPPTLTSVQKYSSPEVINGRVVVVAVDKTQEELDAEAEAAGIIAADQKATEIAKMVSVEQVIDTLSDEDVEVLTYIYPAWSGEGVALAVDEKVRHAGILYKVVQAHTTQADWTPDVTPALFTRYRDPAAGPEPWVQPTGAQDAYQIDEQVTHNGQAWTNTVNDNVWEPGVYGWI